jgi:hypothetical protein
MDSLSKLDEPFFGTPGDADAYITRELKRILPDGWKVSRPPGDILAWAIEKTDINAGEWPNQNYWLRVARGLDVVILTHSNRDVGIFGLHHALHHAMVIDATMLRRFGLVECVSYVMSNCKPNKWGYT